MRLISKLFYFNTILVVLLAALLILKSPATPTVIIDASDKYSRQEIAAAVQSVKDLQEYYQLIPIEKLVDAVVFIDCPEITAAGAVFLPPTNTIIVCTKQLSISELWVLNIIEHETCHAIQYAEGRPFDECECYTISMQIGKWTNLDEKSQVFTVYNYWLACVKDETNE